MSDPRQPGMKQLHDSGFSYTAIGRSYDLSGKRVKQIIFGLPANKPITAACEMCGKVRTGQGQTSLGLICKSCYHMNATEPKNVKKVIKVIRQTHEVDRHRRFTNEL